jgi:hypothetical protein
VLDEIHIRVLEFGVIIEMVQVETQVIPPILADSDSSKLNSNLVGPM